MREQKLVGISVSIDVNLASMRTKLAREASSETTINQKYLRSTSLSPGTPNGVNFDIQLITVSIVGASAERSSESTPGTRDTELESDSQLLGFILQNEKTNSIQLGVDIDQLVLTHNRKFAYAVLHCESQLHVLAINLAIILDNAAAIANSKRIRHEAKILGCWPKCRVIATLPSQLLVVWLCHECDFTTQFSAKPLSTPTTDQAPKPGLIRKQMGFTTSQVWQYISKTTGYKSACIPTDKFLKGLAKYILKNKQTKTYSSLNLSADLTYWNQKVTRDENHKIIPNENIRLEKISGLGMENPFIWIPSQDLISE